MDKRKKIKIILGLVFMTLGLSSDFFFFIFGGNYLTIIFLAIGLILIINATLTKPKVIETINDKNTEITQNTKSSKPKSVKGALTKIFIGLVPIITFSIIAIDDAVNGFTFFWNTTYGFRAFFTSLLYYYSVFSIFIILGIVFIVLGIKDLISIKKDDNQ